MALYYFNVVYSYVISYRKVLSSMKYFPQGCAP